MLLTVHDLSRSATSARCFLMCSTSRASSRSATRCAVLAQQSLRFDRDAQGRSAFALVRLRCS
jgi:hypothetical protein